MEVARCRKLADVMGACAPLTGLLTPPPDAGDIVRLSHTSGSTHSQAREGIATVTCSLRIEDGGVGRWMLSAEGVPTGGRDDV